jgi:hypothetical protein
MAFVAALVAAPLQAASISAFSIYAQNNVQIGSGTIVGTPTQLALVGAGTGAVAVGDASLNGTAGIYGDLRAGDDVSLGNNAFVTGTITNPDQYTIGSGVVVGSHVVAMPDLPVLPAATDFTVSGASQTVANGGTLTLAPGFYQDITLGGAATLNLTAGDYYLNSLQAGNGLTINVALGGGDIRLFIKTTFNAGGIAAMNLTGGTWANVYAEAQGFGVTGSALNNVFRISGGNGTNWKGTVLTTNGGIHLGSGSSTGTIEGYLWSAQNVDLEHGLNVIPPPVVPVPAAVWLFGSALAGLGLLRHRARR